MRARACAHVLRACVSSFARRIVGLSQFEAVTVLAKGTRDDITNLQKGFKRFSDKVPNIAKTGFVVFISSVILRIRSKKRVTTGHSYLT